MRAMNRDEMMVEIVSLLRRHGKDSTAETSAVLRNYIGFSAYGIELILFLLASSEDDTHKQKQAKFAGLLIDLAKLKNMSECHYCIFLVLLNNLVNTGRIFTSNPRLLSAFLADGKTQQYFPRRPSFEALNLNQQLARILHNNSALSGESLEKIQNYLSENEKRMFVQIAQNNNPNQINALVDYLVLLRDLSVEQVKQPEIRVALAAILNLLEAAADNASIVIRDRVRVHRSAVRVEAGIETAASSSSGAAAARSSSSEPPLRSQANSPMMLEPLTRAEMLNKISLLLVSHGMQVTSDLLAALEHNIGFSTKVIQPILALLVSSEDDIHKQRQAKFVKLLMSLAKLKNMSLCHCPVFEELLSVISTRDETVISQRWLAAAFIYDGQSQQRFQLRKFYNVYGNSHAAIVNHVLITNVFSLYNNGYKVDQMISPYHMHLFVKVAQNNNPEQIKALSKYLYNLSFLSAKALEHPKLRRNLANMLTLIEDAAYNPRAEIEEEVDKFWREVCKIIQLLRAQGSAQAGAVAASVSSSAAAAGASSSSSSVAVAAPASFSSANSHLRPAPEIGEQPLAKRARIGVPPPPPGPPPGRLALFAQVKEEAPSKEVVVVGSKRPREGDDEKQKEPKKPAC